MPPALRYALLALAVLAFLVVSAALARVLAAAGAERAAVVDLIEAQARGDRREVVTSLVGCRGDPRCANRVAGNVARLRGGGTVSVLRVDGPPRLALGPRTGTARIAWRARERLPVVQCVRMRRAGSVLAGFRIQLLALSDPRPREAGCRGFR